MKPGFALIFFLLYAKVTGYAVALLQPDTPNENRVVVVTLDGLRWQEVFGGADPVLLQAELVKKENADLRQFVATDAESRRQQLMPFLWNIVAQEGQLAGNRQKGSKMNTANPYALSYPGYNELFTGTPDLLIWGNDKVHNSNRTIFEYLNGISAFKGKVASFASWDAFPFILAENRSRIKVAIGKALQNGVRADTATFGAARDYIVKHRPKVLHIGFGGTDEAAHSKEYNNYLRQAHLADGLIANLWQLLQQLPEYRNNTSLIITTDHGRGRSRSSWHEHGFFVPGSSETWMAMLGKGFAALGESSRNEQLYNAQVAGTIGFLVQVNSFRPYTIPLDKISG